MVLSLTINRFLDLIADYLERNREFAPMRHMNCEVCRWPSSVVLVDVTLNSDRSVAEYQDLLVEIADECGQLGVLVKQLLLLAETDTARFEIERKPGKRPDRLGLRAARSEMFARCRGTWHSTHRRLLARYAGPGRWRPISTGAINNLIDNSLKFTPRGGRVQIELKPDTQRQQAILRVTDSGAGIDPADLPHVFERFYRGDKSRARERSAHGNGLGF